MPRWLDPGSQAANYTRVGFDIVTYSSHPSSFMVAWSSRRKRSPMSFRYRPLGITTFSTRAYAASRASFTVGPNPVTTITYRSEEHTSELQSQSNLVCRLLLEKKKKTNISFN